MNLVIKTYKDEGWDNCDQYIVQVETEAGEAGILAQAGEPEDMYLHRDLGFVYRIPDMIELAYEAGKAGEPFRLFEETLENPE